MNEKRLIKGHDRKLCGVCSGIAEYFDFDPTIVRIAFLVGFLCCGVGLIAYLASAIVMPNE